MDFHQFLKSLYTENGKYLQRLDPQNPLELTKILKQEENWEKRDWDLKD